jgi:glycosyltransferase involved in cell wall biosynthesis
VTRAPQTETRTRVLFVHHRSELGGAPTSLSYVIRSLDRKRFEPHVYCPLGPASELFREAGATVHEGTVASFTHIWASTYRGRRWLLLLRELGRLPLHLFAFGRVLGRNRFDIVHLNDSPMIPAAWLARRAGTPVVWHLRSAPPEQGRDRRSRFVRKAVLRLADAVVAINHDIARLWDIPARVIPNSVEIDRFRPGDSRAARSVLDLPLDRPVVAYFGFLYPSKGFQEFIRAASLMRERGIEATYLIVGGGVRSHEFFRTPLGVVLKILDLARDYDAEARALVDEHGLESSFRFVPFTRDTDDLYRASDIVVAPSQGPEIGRPMLEGAASGVAVIGTGTQTGGGIFERDKTTILTDDFRAATLAKAVTELLDDPERRQEIGRAARKHAVQMFDPARNARRIEQLYDRLVPRSGRAQVLFVHHRPQLGGAPSSLAELIRNLDRARFDPHVFVPDGPAAQLFADADALVHIGPVSIFAHAWDNPYAGFRWLVLSREVSKLVPHLRSLNRLVKRYRFPIVHLNDSPLLPAAWVARRNGANVIWHLRSALASEGRDRRSRVISRLIDRWGTAAIAIDEDVADRFPIRLPVTIVHNSVRRTQPAVDPVSAKRRVGLPADAVAIGYAGFVRRQKGWPELIHAARLLVDEGLPAHFVIIGGGVRPPAFFDTWRGKALALVRVLTDEESAIKPLVEELGLEPHVSFLPVRPDLQEVYDALDIVAFPNPGVGLGRPVLEAAAFGKPVVASGSRYGAGLLLPEETGILLAEADPRALADALRRLVVAPELRTSFGEAAAAHAREHFDPLVNARRVEAVYDEVLGRVDDVAGEEAEDALAAASAGR